MEEAVKPEVIEPKVVDNDLILKAVVIWLFVPIGGIIFWAMKDPNKLVIRNSKLSIYFTIAVFVVYFILFFCVGLLSLIPFVGCIVAPLSFVLMLIPLALQLYFGIKMAQGETVRVEFLEKYL